MLGIFPINMYIFGIHCQIQNIFFKKGDGQIVKFTTLRQVKFLYFSYIIGTSAQTADVSITTKHMRLLNLFHAVLSFGFNTTILAICINVAAGFLTN